MIVCRSENGQLYCKEECWFYRTDQLTEQSAERTLLALYQRRLLCLRSMMCASAFEKNARWRLFFRGLVSASWQFLLEFCISGFGCVIRG